MTLARSLNHPFTMAYTLHHTAVFLLWRGDSEGAQKRARAMCEVAEAHGFQIWNSLAEILQGAVQTARGETEAGLARIEQGFREYQGLKSPPVFFPELVNIRALAYAQAGKGGAALELIDAFVKDAGDEMVLLQAPEMALLKGELLLAKSSENRAEAAALWRWVLDASLQMEGKLMALRAAMRLCRLEASEGNIGEGCRLLREIYGSFTEGFETVALREARGMLEELGDRR